MAAGDRDAFALFYDACAPLAYGVLRRMLDPEEAAEVLQDVFLELWRRAGEYDSGRGTPEAWVLVRARSRGIDRLRSSRRREEMIASPLTDVAADETAPNPGVVVEERDTVRGALAALPEPQRRVIDLAFFAGLTQSEIAARLALPLGTVKTRMRLGMDRLRALVGGSA
jgi:RNA polymerase sigma-70 factor (ECF subfamily)